MQLNKRYGDDHICTMDTHCKDQSSWRTTEHQTPRTLHWWSNELPMGPSPEYPRRTLDMRSQRTGKYPSPVERDTHITSC